MTDVEEVVPSWLAVAGGDFYVVDRVFFVVVAFEVDGVPCESAVGGVGGRRRYFNTITR